MADDFSADIKTSGRLVPGGSLSGSFESSYDSDWVRITLQAGSTYLFSLNGARAGEGTLPQSSYISLSMMDGKGASIYDGIRVNNGISNLAYQFTPKTSGDYFINVGGSYETGTYTLKATTPAADDYSADVRTIGQLQDGVATAAVLERADDVDWFKFHADAGQVIDFTTDGVLTMTSAYVYRMVYGAGGAFVSNLGSSPFIASKSGDYYLGVQASNTTGAYSVTMHNIADDYSGDNSHPGQLGVGGTASGSLDYYGDADRFQMTMEAGKFYTLTLTGSGNAAISMRVSGANGTSDSTTTATNGVSTLHFLATVSGTYSVDISGYNSSKASYYLAAAWPELDDHGETRDTATAITLDVPTSGRLQASSDTDMFKIDLKAGVTYRFDIGTDVSATGMNSYLSDSTGSSVASQYDSKFYTYTPSKDGTYYMSESSYYAGANAVAYTVTASLAADDFGATAGTAGRLFIGGAQKGVLEEGGGDRDWFAVSLQEGGYYWFSLAGAADGGGTLTTSSGSATLNLLDASGKVVATANGMSSGIAPLLPFTASAGTYYLEVAAPRYSGSYTVKAQYGVKDDYGNDTAHAAALALGTPVAGTLELPSDKDVFKISGVAGTTYQLDFTLPKAGANWQYQSNIGIGVTDGTQSYIGTRVTYDGNKATVLFEAAKSGDYYLTVNGGWQTSANTAYTLAAKAIAVDDYAANTSTTARIDPATPLHGEINFIDDRDWIRLHLDAGRTYVFDLQGSKSGGGTLDTSAFGSYSTAGMSLMNANGSSVANSTIPANGNGVDPRIQYIATSSGDYYLSVYGNGKNIGTYTVQEVQTNLDTTGPHLLSSDMAAGAANVPVQTAIVLNFDETIMLGSGISLTDANGTVINGNGNSLFKVAGHTLTIDPHIFFKPGMTYTVNLPQGSVLDLAGNPTTAQSFSFTTVKPVTSGTDGNDYLIGSGTGLTLNGGAGLDTVYYGQDSYLKFRNVDGSFQVRSYSSLNGGGDTLTGVERLLFTYNAYALDIDGVAGQAYRLYQSAFHRTPDSTGLGYWIAAMDRGQALRDVASNFIASKEFNDTYGATSDAAFVNLLYQNVLHRDPDAGGKAYWLNAMQNDATRAALLADFSESTENHANVAQIIGNGFYYTPYTG